MNLKGKVALVTGAGTGVGKGIALELAREGVKIAVNYNSSEQGAQDTKEKVESLGSEAILIKANVSKKDQVEIMVNKAIENFGRIDILINNAATQKNLYMLEYTDEDFDLVMDVNLKGYFLCTQAVIPYMKKNNWGRIINISSVHAKRPTGFDPVYAMTKGGIKMLTRESAIEFVKYGITVNTLELGAIEIGIKSGNPLPLRVIRNKDNPNRKHIMGRMGTPKDVGQLAKFIASEESEYMTGSSIRLDGGRMLV